MWRSRVCTAGRSRQDPRFREILNRAALVVPDGMPLVWLGRWHGHSLARVTGSELMLAFCRETGPGPRHFFYGGAPGVAEDLARQLHERFNITVAGTYTPPFRPLTQAEEAGLTAQVDAAAPDVLWVGLSTPKQERWMSDHHLKLKVPVILGVGAAFDMNSGRLKRAPAWMRDSGLEWFYRLLKRAASLMEALSGNDSAISVEHFIGALSHQEVRINLFPGEETAC